VLRLLGPVRWEAAAGQLDLGTIKQRTMLAALAVEAGRLVSWSELVDRVWDQAPANGVRRLYTYANRIRRLLETVEGAGAGPPARLARGSAGYLLHLDPDLVDLHRFRRLQAAAGDGRRPDAERARLLGEALGLWQGSPLADLPGEWPARMRLAWCPHRVEAAVAWAEAQLRLGEPAPVIGVVRELAVEYPLAEPLTGVLIRALAGVGRHAEALDCYAGHRTRLVEQLGTEPGAELRELHEALLRCGLPRSRPAARPGSRGGDPARPTPAQLPGDVPGFTGRRTELATLDRWLSRPTMPAGTHQWDSAAAGPTAVVISAIDGTAGVGKTALAVHWAHRVAARFPDGHLYVNLRGYDPDRPVSAAEALAGFLRALGVPDRDIPAEQDERAARYRSLLNGRQMLVILDNAGDVEQVRPLLPGSAACMTVVTSRDALAGLVARDGATRLDLDLLPLEEAVTLLRSLVGGRADADPEAAAVLAARCARLPLALRIAAEFAAAHPAIPLADLVGELADQQQRLDLLDAAGDGRTAIRAVFSWSYDALTPAAAGLFRLLGLHPGPDISAAAAASLAGLPPAETRRLLAALTRASLLTEHNPGRYGFHDLLRAYAVDLTHTHDPEDHRRAAVGRLLDHYLHTAHTADRLLYPARDPIPLALTPPGVGVTPEQLAGNGQVMAWLTAEHPVLLAAVRLAAETGFDTHTWQLAWTLTTFLHRRGHWHDLTTAWQTALPAAGRRHDPAAHAYAHRLLAQAHIRLGRYPDAHTHLQHALHLFTQAGDHTGQAGTHNALSMLWERQGRPEQALDHAQRALTLYRAAGHRRGQANTLNGVGWCHARLGDHQQALTYCQQALTLHQELDDRDGQAQTWDSIGYAHHHLAHHTQATDCYQHALHLYRDLGDRYYEAATLTHLGETHHAAGDPTAARTAWAHALDILTDLDHPDTHIIRGKLHDLDQSTPGRHGQARTYPVSSSTPAPGTP